MGEFDDSGVAHFCGALIVQVVRIGMTFMGVSAFAP
jgi:predicted ABC-type sugar transport system permease subunit